MTTCKNGDSSCVIVVRRGCIEEKFDIEDASQYESERQLLARVYGTVPLEDSAELYGKWADNCHEIARRKNLRATGMFAGLTGLGGVSLFLAYEFAVKTKDLPDKLVRYGGTGAAVTLLGLGAGFLLTDILVLSIYLIIPNREKSQAEEYERRCESYRLRFAPALDLIEPSGGVIMRLDF